MVYKSGMETILDHHPTPFELHHLGYTDDEDSPLTDELRDEILSFPPDPIALSCLMSMRGDEVQAKRYLELLPADDGLRRGLEELRAEWSILKH
jgi:hypothetical protein